MAFTFISHGSRHLEITSDDNRRLRFEVVKDERGQPRMVCRQPQDRSQQDQPWAETLDRVMQEAARFASLCARDVGLI